MNSKNIEEIIDILNKHRTISEVGSLRDIAEELTNLLKQQEQEIRKEAYKEGEKVVREFAQHIEDLVKEGRVLALAGEMPTSIAETYLKQKQEEDK